MTVLLLGVYSTKGDKGGGIKSRSFKKIKKIQHGSRVNYVKFRIRI